MSWEWTLDDEGTIWRPFDSQANAQIEESFQNKQEQIDLNVGYFANYPQQYRVVFSGLFQVNLNSGYTRSIRRHELHETDQPEDLNSQMGSTRQQRILSELKIVLLSPDCLTEAKSKPSLEELPMLSDNTIREILKEHVADIESMLDRTEEYLAIDFIIATYHDGLPNYRSDPIIHAHLLHSIRYIFTKVPSHPSQSEQSYIFNTLAEAFQSCQAEQARVIDMLYGRASGRDQGFREQVLALVDEKKGQVLTQLIATTNPINATDANPSQQYVHIRSRYLVDIGHQLGLRGTQAAKQDFNMPVPRCASKKQELISQYHHLLDMNELVEEFIADVNQSDDALQRFIDRDKLAAFALKLSEVANDFNAHSIYFDEDHQDLYESPPTNINQPYLHKSVAVDLLYHLFLNPETKNLV